MISQLDRSAILLPLLATLILVSALYSAGDPDALARSPEAFASKDWIVAEREARAATQEQPGNARAHRMLGIVFGAHQCFSIAGRYTSDSSTRRESISHFG